MSPASQGSLEVESYIGSCLISGRSSLQKPVGWCRKQEQQSLRNSKHVCESQCQGLVGPVGTWAGGAPLISMALNPRRNNQRSSLGQQTQQQQQKEINYQSISEQQLPIHLHNRLPLSRLAIHTHGAPLILSGRFYNNRFKNQNNQTTGAIVNCVAAFLKGCSNTDGNVTVNSGVNPRRSSQPAHRPSKPTNFDQRKAQQGAKATDEPGSDTSSTITTPSSNVANIDSLSIASDESSGSNNSENGLPRIIKPRKRRKKDRKPQMVLGVLNPVNAVLTNNVKIIDELLVSVNSPAPLALVPHGLLEQQQQQPQQLKPYPITPYDETRNSGDNYYKMRKKPMNNGRDGNYERINSANTCNANCVKNNNSSSSALNPEKELVNIRQQQQRNGKYVHRHVQVKVLDDNRNLILPVPVCQAKTNYLRHSNSNNKNVSTVSNPRYQHDCNEPGMLTCHQDATGVGMDNCIQDSLCQCRYCDLGAFIWDVNDKNGYSRQYLTQSSLSEFNGVRPNHHRLAQVPTTIFLASTRPFICQKHSKAIEFFDMADNSCLWLRSAMEKPKGTSATHKRSWSDPTNYFSDEIVPNCGVGVIGDRGQGGHSQKGKSSWRGDASTVKLSLSPSPATLPGSSGHGSGAARPGGQGPLEVSTEIVTSLNGHRDLEIKFYSSSSVSYVATSDGIKSPFTLPDESIANDSEDFNDIWSYYESKLQQDLRTLLQAEE